MNGSETAPELTLRGDVEPVVRADAALSGVFIPPFESCQPAREGDEPGTGPDGQVCTQVAISGCTEPGKYFPDYGSCDIVRTQRPFWPEAPAREPSADDPRLNDSAFMDELAWMTEQIEASGCTCCHDANVGETGQWDIRHGPIWLDTLSDSGLALFIGLADSSSLGAFPAQENFGFDRSATGIPTTDTERMQAFLGSELERRGITREQAAEVPPFGGPIYQARITPPSDCTEQGFGIDPQLAVQWSGGPARYVFVLADGSDNPGVPPNLDQPAGTLWKLDVLPSAEPIQPGLRYGTTPAGSFQALPARGAAPQLKTGTTYQLTVLRDVGLPLANCRFEFGRELSQPSASAADSGTPPERTGGDCTLSGGDANGFGAGCQTDADCSCSANYCALMPGQAQGVCTVTGCIEDASLCPAGYSCLDLSLFAAELPSICRN